MQHDTIIIDEAYERSLNIDFLLGCLKELLPRRPDLKIIIMLATIDSERFSKYFNNAPIIEISGRTYPTGVRYRPIVGGIDDTERDQLQVIFGVMDELGRGGPGDILTFMSDEREICDTVNVLDKLGLRCTEVPPLYAHLLNSGQNRMFRPHSGHRIMLATNAVEASLTVSDIKYMIDPGIARISRYSYRTKAQHLPIELASQASVNQRKGRCGRTSEGVCTRLYPEDDLLSRSGLTNLEILRTNLASVILQVIALGLGDVATFPSAEVPDKRNIQDGVRLLGELGVITTDEQVTAYGLAPLSRQLSQPPVDPCLVRVVLET